MAASSRIYEIFESVAVDASLGLSLVGIGSAGVPRAPRVMTHPDDGMVDIVYPFNPTRTTNFDVGANEPLLAPITRLQRTLTSTQLTRFEGSLSDVSITERWEAQEGSSSSTFASFFRQMYNFWINPPPFATNGQEYIQWQPRDAGSRIFNVELVRITIGGGGDASQLYDLTELIPLGGTNGQFASGDALGPLDDFDQAFSGVLDRTLQVHFKIVSEATPSTTATDTVIPVTSIASPDAVPGLGLWLDASDASTITLNGSDVDIWTDKALARTFTAPSAPEQPAVLTADQNGLDSIDFGGDGAAEKLVGSDVGFGSSTEGITFFIAFKNDTSGAPDDLLTKYHVSGARVFECFTDGFRVYESGSAPAVGDIADLDAALDTTSPRVQRYVWDPANIIEIFSNGTFGGEGTVIASDLLAAASAITVGHRDNAAATTTFFDGQIYEILGYARQLTAAETAGIETYLTTKWGI